jgi:hypothetical protein
MRQAENICGMSDWLNDVWGLLALSCKLSPNFGTAVNSGTVTEDVTVPSIVELKLERQTQLDVM